MDLAAEALWKARVLMGLNSLAVLGTTPTSSFQFSKDITVLKSVASAI